MVNLIKNFIYSWGFYFISVASNINIWGTLLVFWSLVFCQKTVLMLDGGPRFQCLFLTALFWTLSWWRQCKAKGSMLQGTRFRAGRDFSKGGAAAWEGACDCCSGEALTLAWSEQAPCSATTHTPQAQFGQNSCLVLWLCLALRCKELEALPLQANFPHIGQSPIFFLKAVCREVDYYSL